MAKRKDMRRINKVWDACNPRGEWFTFAWVGSGRNRVLVTLHAGSMRRPDQNLVGELWKR